MAQWRFVWFMHQRAEIPFKGQRHRKAGLTGKPQGTCIPVPLAVMSIGSEGHKFLKHKSWGLNFSNQQTWQTLARKNTTFFLHRTPTSNQVQTAWRQWSETIPGEAVGRWWYLAVHPWEAVFVEMTQWGHKKFRALSPAASRQSYWPRRTVRTFAAKPANTKSQPWNTWRTAFLSPRCLVHGEQTLPLGTRRKPWPHALFWTQHCAGLHSLELVECLLSQAHQSPPR